MLARRDRLMIQGADLLGEIDERATLEALLMPRLGFG